MTRFDYEAIEAAGHDVTMLSGLTAGTTTYYCENCASIMLNTHGELALFHPPRGSHAAIDKCWSSLEQWLEVAGPSEPALRDKLKKLHKQQLRQLRRVGGSR
jgi:hypothetical protein